jgi:Leucine rich repeat
MSLPVLTLRFLLLASASALAADFLHCDFFYGPLYGYTCDLGMFNPTGRNDLSITGEHYHIFTDEDVRDLWTAGVTSNIPLTICERFPMTYRLMMPGLGIITVEASALTRCVQLEVLDLNGNDITQIMFNAFGSMPRLQQLSVQNNRVFRIERQVLDQATSLDAAEFAGNGCIDENFYDFSGNRDAYMARLAGCF